MNEQDLQRIVNGFKKYNIEIKYDGLLITKINDQNAKLDVRTYMPNQMVELICNVMKTKIINDIWNNL
ncbi:hypothetical protein MOO46_03980 [Apilactobacillus apisilvae]|uniref:Uncharacterized protein n=1 Tax=Apilactobacillus apisilvae TaxID=2923364 RepID=A0ABY4PFN4_9LACO|nr:hypothetical protein [Apilactobacillus apisilvae]UQS84422.1 hypothetical protein MOO46_03980 [Apilactobacillus apisilvae]